MGKQQHNTDTAIQIQTDTAIQTRTRDRDMQYKGRTLCLIKAI